MPGVVRLGDICTGHGCYPPRSNVGASGNVFCDGIGVHRQGDPWDQHSCGVCSSHGGQLAAGSPNVYVNGVQCGRIGDPVTCGSSAATGSSGVYCNG